MKITNTLKGSKFVKLSAFLGCVQPHKPLFFVIVIKAIETGIILLIMDIKTTFMYFFKDL
jgi:hypothetical protein